MNRLDCQAQYEQFLNLFQSFSRVTLLNADHETLFLKYQTLSDIGTLPQSVEISNRYLHIQDGDIVLTNDPYSGGTLLSSPTLVMGIGLRTFKGQVPAELLVASRLTLCPRVGAFKNVDEEGLRIPPSPYYIRGCANLPIVEALRTHPQSPKNFTEQITAECLRLLDLRDKIKTRIQSGELDFSKARMKKYIQCSETAFKRRLDDMGEGSGFSELDITPNETIKLKLEHHDSHFNFDFTGTTSGETLFLTDSTTIGVAVGTVLSLLNQDVPINSGVYSHFDVKAPKGSLVNAAFPRPLFLGHTDGVNILANVIVRCMSQLRRKHSWASSGCSYCSYEIRFRHGRTFVDSLPIGAGASISGPGLSGIDLWRRVPTDLSVENWERRFPLQIINTGFRPESGGDGKHSGGMGAVRSLRVLEDATLHWAHAQPLHKPEGIDGGRSALGAEMIIERTDGQKEELAYHGQADLKKGDILTVLSPGGGGYG